MIEFFAFLTTLVFGSIAGFIGIYFMPSLGPIVAIAVSTAFIVHSLEKIAEGGRDGNNSPNEK